MPETRQIEIGSKAAIDGPEEPISIRVSVRQSALTVNIRFTGEPRAIAPDKKQASPQ